MTEVIDMPRKSRTFELVGYGKTIDLDRDICAQLKDTPFYEEACQIRDDARQARIAEIEEPSVQAARDRIIGLAKVHFGEAEGQRLQAIIESGMTASQYEALAPQLTPGRESAELRKLHAVRAELESALNQPAGDADFMAAVERIMESEKVTKSEAMSRVAAQQPELHRRFIQSKNPNLEIPK
ncbi:hypothetical protein [Desulfosarcina ovata]|nr:hypothetical protein [Desulfosarcina ovata]